MTKQDFTFERYPEIAVEEVRFKNRYGIELSGVVFTLTGEGRHPAVVVSGPFGAVKEQSSDLYAQELVIVEGADHADLYDQMDKIPFAKLDEFFKENLR